MSKEVEVRITSGIRQEDDSAVLERESLESLERTGNNWRLKYNEKNKEDDIEVKLLIKPNGSVMQRGDVKDDHTSMKFEPGERQECKVMAVGKQMDLVSLTNRLDFSKISPGKMQLKVEYDPSSSLYSVGNYTIKTEMTDL